MRTSWLNPAGGLRYHARALFAGHAWAPFKSALASWLSEFEPLVPRAVLVGPSAGYSLPDAFLRRFESVVVLEPDPVAGFLLQRRLRTLGVCDVRLETRDLLLAPLLHGGPGLAQLLVREPQVSLIFGNLLGQTRFLCKEAEFDRFKSAFRAQIQPLLVGRAWLSFHDRLSGALSPSFAQPFRARARLSDEAVLKDLYRSDRGGEPAELFDHHSDGFFPAELPHAYFNWQITRARYHLIEGVAVSRVWNGG